MLGCQKGEQVRSLRMEKWELYCGRQFEVL